MTDTSVTQDDLYNRLVGYLNLCYGEIDKYEIDLSEDITSTGISRFQQKITTARGWSNRVLGMIREAKRWFNQVRSLSEGKKALWERSVVQYSLTQTWDKKFSADERRAQSELQFVGLYDDFKKWNDLTSELRSLVDALEAKHKDLINTKDDLKSLLWSVRLQLALGEGNVRVGAGELSARMAKPVFEPDSVEDDLNNKTPARETIDDLLKGK